MSEREATSVREGRWRKSSFSEGGGDDCVEVDFISTGVAVRDSKNAAGPRLAFDHLAWQGFLSGSCAQPPTG